MQSNVMTYCSNLELRESANIKLYSAEGKVLSLSEFCIDNLHLLTAVEQEVVKAYLEELSQIEPLFISPLVRTPQHSDGKHSISAKRSGSRSAYIPEVALKIKGCRPENATFPSWNLDERFDITIKNLPLGVLTAEAGMREILAYCFMKKHRLPTFSEPKAVFMYKPKGGFMHYALVSHVACDTRVEQFIDCKGYTLHDVIRLRRSGELWPLEVELNGMSQDEYIARKTDLLIGFNFYGGFRGLLNSNLGNDVISNGKLYCLCDFDSFKIMMPRNGELNQIHSLVINAFLELIKTSLPFIDYLDFNCSSEISSVHAELAVYYQSHSSIYQMYRKKFLRNCRLRKWPVDFVENCIQETFKTLAAFEMLQELIPNSYTLEHFNPNSLYIPHN